MAWSQRVMGQSCPEDLFPAYDKESRLYGYQNLGGEWLIPANYVKVYPFSGNKAIVQKGSKLGIVNCKGYLVADAVYDDFLPFNFDKVWAKQNGLWGLMTDKGQLLVRPTYNEVLKICQECDQVWVKKMDKWGLFSEKSNKLLIVPTFLSVKPISPFVSLVELSDSIGVVDHGTGSYVMKPNLLKVSKVYKYFAFKTKYGKWGVMGDNGNVMVEPTYDTLAYATDHLLIAKKEGKWGLLNYKSQVIQEFKFDQIGSFTDGQAVCILNGKYGLINRSGKLFFKPEFDFVSPFHQVSIAKKGKKFGLIDMGGVPKLAFEYDSIYEVNGLQLLALKKTGYYQLLKREGLAVLYSDLKLVDELPSNNLLRLTTDAGVRYLNVNTLKLEPDDVFEQGLSALKGHLVVSKGGNWGVVNRMGKQLISFEFDSIKSVIIDGNTYFSAFKKGKTAFYDYNGVLMLPAIYDFVSLEEGKLFKVSKNGQFGLLNSKGEEITDIKYGYISNKINQKDLPSFPAIFQKGKKSGLLSQSGKEIEVGTGEWSYLGQQLYANFKDGKFEIYKSTGGLFSSEKLDSVTYVDGDLIPAKKDKLWGYLSLGGKWSLTPQFEWAGNFKSNLALVKKNGLYGVINMQGKWIVPAEFTAISEKDKTLMKDQKRYKLNDDGSLKLLR